MVACRIQKSDPSMPVSYQDKPIELLREEVIDQLIMNYGHGQISLQAFERRLDQAYELSDHQQLHALTEDLVLEVNKEYADKKREEFGIRYSSEPADSVDWMVDIMGGSKRGGAWQVPPELRVITLMGGGEVDFSSAQFSAQDVRVRVACVMGGVDIKIPEGVSVYSKVVSIMGGVETKGYAAPSEDGPRIIIEGVVIMGGINVTVKRPRRETWRSFADEVRRAFGFSASEPPYT